MLIGPIEVYAIARQIYHGFRNMCIVGHTMSIVIG